MKRSLIASHFLLLLATPTLNIIYHSVNYKICVVLLWCQQWVIFDKKSSRKWSHFLVQHWLSAITKFSHFLIHSATFFFFFVWKFPHLMVDVLFSLCFRNSNQSLFDADVYNLLILFSMSCTLVSSNISWKLLTKLLVITVSRLCQ